VGAKLADPVATRTGSTVGVAEAIGQTLSEVDAQIDLLPMEEVEDLTPHHPVVAGSAIQGGRWLPEALQFVRTHQIDLAGRPFAAFLVCMTLAMKRGDHRERVASWLAEALEDAGKPSPPGCWR
jgi:menaquinone-dependent protoporphyrinogen oxidase